jgi:GNAT superfamily N-acetyltransferase
VNPPSEEYIVSSDPLLVDVDVVHAFLRTSYWAPEIPREVVLRSIQGSIVFGVYHALDGQVAFARVVTDRATFAYLADVFVLPAHRGKRLSRRLMDAVRDHPELQGLRRWMLVTRDAHGVYEQYGFGPLSAPERVMERTDPEVYRRMLSPANPLPVS